MARLGENFCGAGTIGLVQVSNDHHHLLTSWGDIGFVILNDSSTSGLPT